MIVCSQIATDRALRKQLRSAADSDAEYWSFRHDATRRHAHAIFQYPAMMVPQMQARLIADVCEVCPSSSSVYDPFVGSGTVLTEAMLQGLDFFGQDINPLAILLCRVKSGPFYADAICDRVTAVCARICADRRKDLAVDFPGVHKWFRADVATALSRIVRSVRQEPELWSRRFFWVALAETIRLTSNSRTSTVKLHIRPKEEVRSRLVQPIELFQHIASTNATRLTAKYELLKQANHVSRGHYSGSVEVVLANSAYSNAKVATSQFDLLITSPPYGDNVTTVTYGQHAYLPLQWIDRADIDANLDERFLATTHAIDSLSLGGRRKGASDSVSELRDRSKSFGRTIDMLHGERRDRSLRVAAFVRDLDRCLPPILSRLRKNAYMVWIVGNRCVGGRLVPLDEILCQLLESRGAVHVTSIERQIPSKRMALHNGISSTMTKECMLVMRKDKA